MKKHSVTIIFIALLFWGCSSTQTTVEDRTISIPIKTVHDTIRGAIEYVPRNIACDTAEILAELCKGEASNTTGGIDYKTRWWVERVKGIQIRDSLGKIAGEYDGYRYRAKIDIATLKDSLSYRDTTEYTKGTTRTERIGMFFVDAGICVALFAGIFLAKKFLI